jgi:hypothetical protein
VVIAIKYIRAFTLQKVKQAFHRKIMLQHFIYLQVDGELMLAPGFPAPPNTDYLGYHTYIGMFMKFVKKSVRNKTLHNTLA